jgi:signal peptidase I
VALGVNHLWKNEYFKTTVTLVVVVAIVFGLWFGLQALLGTRYPVLAVASGSMSMVQPDDRWSYPFVRTLHTGDLIIIEGVDPNTIKAAPYPDGDIIVFLRQTDGALIVHRAIAEQAVGGKLNFTTKGDGNPISDQDAGQKPVPEENIIGKVILRIPWVGNYSLFMHDSSTIYLIVIVIIVLIIVEFAIPSPGTKKPETVPGENFEDTFKT